MSNPVSVSYSGASKYKRCPTLFYLSKKWQDKGIPSALPFGKAIEKGVDLLLAGYSLTDAQGAFTSHWEVEHLKDNEYRQIFDNLDISFYASDFDKNLFATQEDQDKLTEWTSELLESDKDWLEEFDNVSERLKSSNGVQDAELAFYNRVVWECCKIRGCVMLEAFANNILPELDLTQKEHFASQKEISMVGDQGDKISGYIDYVVYHKREGWIILDLKTAAYPYERHALETSEQLRTYVAAIGQDIGSNKAGYAVLLKKVKIDKSCDACGAPREGLAKKCKACGKGEYTKVALRGDTQLIIRDYADDEVSDLVEDYTNVVAAIKNEVNFKNPGSCFAYGRRCEYYDHCWGKKPLNEISHLEERKPLTPTPTEDKV